MAELATRSKFSNRMAFILAAAASAVGLGNLWRFPYLAAKYGGGTFLLVYLLLVVTFGFSLMVAEIALGRKTGLSAVAAYRAANKKFAWLGWLTAAIPFIITPYYSVIGGWVTKYMVSYATTPAADIAADGYFTGFILSSGPSTYIWFLVFFACVALVVTFGLKSGIERSNKVLMPLLIFLAVAIFIYVMTLDGSGAGLKYYLVPSFENYHNVGDFVQLLIAAMGQMFFSLSLAMGIMITYGSYFEKHENIEKSVRTIEIFDTGIAFLAGLMIIPAIFAVSGDGSAVATHAGPGLMFVVLPQTFATLGVAGRIIGFVFFALVFFAALTSAISLMETCVSIVQDQFKTSRKTALISAFAVVALMGIVVNMGYNVWLGADPMHTIFGTPYQANQILDFLDFMSNTVFMPIAALFTCILVGWVIKPKAIIDEVEEGGVVFKAKGLFSVMIKYVAPIFTAMILVGYILNTFGVIHL
ncbi:MAG: sodium-dependent transporter [Coriobacteriales bacterium]|nr:sodium-dependent transporter [Coriobacteriales bacterium]